MIRVEAEIGGLEAGLAKARRFANDDPGNSLYDVVSAELYENAGAGAKRSPSRSGRWTHPSDNNLTLALFPHVTLVRMIVRRRGVLTARLKADPKDYAIRTVLAGFTGAEEIRGSYRRYGRLVAERRRRSH